MRVACYRNMSSTAALALGLACLTAFRVAAQTPEAETPPEAAPSQAEQAPPAEAKAPEPAEDEFADLSLEELLSIEIVEAASRREQTLHDAPSAVSVLDREEIEQMGATHVAELLRRVPGAHVIRLSNNFYDVNLRNQSTFNGSRTLTLLDGRPVLDPVFGFPAYTYLNLAPLELERVEVVRGPGSTLYGAGAAGGVVRLTTRRPLDHQGFEGDVNTGIMYLPSGDDPSAEPASVNNALYGHVGYSVANEKKTFGARGSLRFGLAPEAGTVTVREPYNGQHSYRVSLGLDYRPNEDTTAYLSLSHADVEAVSYAATDPNLPLLAGKEQAITLNLDARNLFDQKLTTSLVADLTGIDFEGIDDAGSSRRAHVLWLNDLTLFDDRSTTTLGGEITHIKGDAGLTNPKSLAYSLVAQQDIALLESRALLLSGAARFETIRYDDGQGNRVYYRNANPRVSVIGKIGENHDLRATAASAYRTPNALEVSTASGVVATPGEPPARLLVPNNQLVPEETQSLELGYRGDLWKRLRVEVVGYMQRVRNVVIATTDRGIPFTYENADDADQLGLEIDLQVAASERTNVYTHWTGRRTRTDEVDLKNAWPDYIFSVGTDNVLPHGVRLHADASFVIGYGTAQVQQLAGTPLLVTQLQDAPNQVDVNLRVGKLLLDGKAEIYVMGRNLAGFFRDRDDLVTSTLSLTPRPVGATVLVGVSLFEG